MYSRIRRSSCSGSGWTFNRLSADDGTDGGITQSPLGLGLGLLLRCGLGFAFVVASGKALRFLLVPIGFFPDFNEPFIACAQSNSAGIGTADLRNSDFTVSLVDRRVALAKLLLFPGFFVE